MLRLSPDEQTFLILCSLHIYYRLEALIRPQTNSRRLLSPREREVLHWLAAGKTAPAVAGILDLSDHTVRSNIKTSLRKLNAFTQAQAVAIAMRIGEISL